MAQPRDLMTNHATNSVRVWAHWQTAETCRSGELGMGTGTEGEGVGRGGWAGYYE